MSNPDRATIQDPNPERKRRIIVEFGPAGNPVTISGQKFFHPDDINGQYLRSGKDSTEALSEVSKSLFVQADASEAPLRSQVADEVIIGDVITSNEIGGAFPEMVEEAYRVLKPGGKLVIKELLWPVSIGQMQALLKQVGFSDIKAVTPEMSEWSQVLEELDSMDHQLFISIEPEVYRLKKRYVIYATK